jgi:streptogramin lyase
VLRVDAASGRVLARIRTPGVGYDSQVAAGLGGVWVTSGRDAGLVYRIDPRTDRVLTTVAVRGSAMGVAIGAGYVWVSSVLAGPGVVSRIDPRADRVVGRAIPVGPGPLELSYGDRAVWVENSSPASLMRLDPATERVATVVAADGQAFGSSVFGDVAADAGSVWRVRNNLLERVDPVTGVADVLTQVPGAALVTLRGAGVWVLAATRLWRVDARSGRIVGRPLRLPPGVALAASARSIWVADERSRTLTRVSG